MTLFVPIEKDQSFSQKLFKAISDNLVELADENQKWPHQMVFSGPLGKEVIRYIEQNEWDFSGFKLVQTGGALNAIVFKYTAPLIKTNDPIEATLEDGLHGRRVEGIPGENTINKIVAHSIGTQFKMERTVRPEKRINLKRENKKP